VGSVAWIEIDPKETKDVLVQSHLPVENGSRDEGRDDGSVDLGSKAVSLVNLHVVGELQNGRIAKSVKCRQTTVARGKTNLEILGEEESVRAGHDSVRLEVIHGEGVSWIDETTNELGKDVEGDLRVGDRVDDTDGDDEDDAESDSEENGRDRGVGGVDWEKERRCESRRRQERLSEVEKRTSETDASKDDGKECKDQVHPFRDLLVL
jgi:hypothetical protein